MVMGLLGVEVRGCQNQNHGSVECPGTALCYANDTKIVKVRAHPYRSHAIDMLPEVRVSV